MSILFGLHNFIIFIIIKVFNCQLYCGINQININYDYPTKKELKLSSDTNYRPIQIYFDTTNLNNDDINKKKLNITITALNSIVKILQKLIEVKQLNYKIVIDENDLNNWGFTDYSPNLLSGIDTDLIVLFKFIEDNNYYMSSEPKYIDEETKRPIVGIIYY